jgi:hypothetical protein
VTEGGRAGGLVGRNAAPGDPMLDARFDLDRDLTPSEHIERATPFQHL